MAARYPDAPQPVDPIEVHINHFFDRVVACVDHRRMTLLTEANEGRLEMAARVTQREQKEQVYVTDIEVNRLFHFKIEADIHLVAALVGKGSRSITHESMHYPEDVKLTPDEIYILSSTDSPCVHVFSYTGNKLRSFVTCGTGMQVDIASFFCLDAEKNLIISDGKDRCIKVFSPNGTLLTTIGQFQDIGFSMNPQGVALINLKLVVIAPGDEFRLQIFS